MKWPRKIEMSLWGEDGVYELHPTDGDWRSALSEYAVTVSGMSLSEILLDIDDAADVLERLSDKFEDAEDAKALLEQEEQILFNADPVLVMREYVLHVEGLVAEDEDPDDEDPEDEDVEDEEAEDEED